MRTLKKANLSDLAQLANELYHKYESKDVVIGLVGQLGAGKTAFVKSFAKHFGIKKIKSPTFIINSVYSLPNRKFYHFDLYRIEDKKQLEHLGFDEIIESKDRIVVIEWADKFPDILKLCDVVINLDILDKNLRNVTVK